MAKCPTCNHEVSIFSNDWLHQPFFRSRDVLGTTTFVCHNCKKELRVTGISNLILTIVVILSAILVGITLKTVIPVLGSVFLAFWLGWRYFIKFKTK